MKRLRVYLSSTFEDLKDYRVAVFAALEKAGLDVARMEAYTAADERPLDLCLRDVAQSDIYVGLYAWRYGYEPPSGHGNPSGKSITELEYRHAESNTLRKLLFFAHPATKVDWPACFKDEITGEGEGGRKLDAFRKALGTEKTASFFRTPDELSTLVLAAIMRTGLGGRPYSIPARAPGFVPRQRLTDALIESLVGAWPTHTLLQGAGGFGKTTLAIDACHHTGVINAYPDGILWTSLGQEPDMATKLGDLCLSGGGDRPSAVGADAIGQALAKVLEGRRCLILVDDAWRGEDLKPFLALEGPRLLVTTPIRNLIEQTGQAGWREVAVDEMGEDEAAALLSRGLSPDETTRQGLSSLAERLGCWALLLELANARLIEERKTRVSLAECVAHVTKLFERRGVLGFDRRDSLARNAAAALSVAAGLEFAEEMFGGLAGKAAEISIFAEDVPIPVRVLADLWAMDTLDVEEEVVRPLHNLSLVRWDRGTDEIRLHDMVRAVLNARLSEVARVHRRLTDAWGDPYCLPHDYAWRWFGWHCVQAKDPTRLQNLLLDFRWLKAKLEATEINALSREFDYVRDEAQFAVLQGALGASTHVLASRPGELATQLVARVPEADQNALPEFFARLRAGAPRPWLRALTPSLAAPALLHVIHAGRRTPIVAVSSDARRVVSVDADGNHTVWDVDRAVSLRTVRWDTNRVRLLSIGATRPWMATTMTQDTTVVWNLDTGECLERTGGLLHTPRTITTENGSERVVWWALVSGGPAWVAITERNLSWDCGDQHGYSAYLVEADGTVRLVVRFSDFSFYAATIVSKGLRLITSSFPKQGTVIWDIKSGTKIGTIRGNQIQTLACDSDGEFVATASFDGIISLWRMDALVANLGEVIEHTRPVVDAKVSKDEALGFTASLDGTAITWDLQTGRPVRRITPEVSSAQHVDWSIENARIDTDRGQVDFLVRDADFRWGTGDLSSYDLATGASVPSPEAPMKSVGDLKIPDNHALFHRPTIELGALVAESKTTPLCISPDGTRGLTSSDQTIWLWDVATGARIASIGMDCRPYCCACTAKAETVIIGEESGRVHILRLEVLPV
jgi:WD40 repeat protein